MDTKIPLLPLVLIAAGVGWIGASVRRQTAFGHLSQPAPAPVPAHVADRIRSLDHDLRTPIGTVATALDLLRIGRTGQVGLDEETMQVLQRQVARLTAIAEALRDLAAESDTPGR